MENHCFKSNLLSDEKQENLILNEEFEVIEIFFQKALFTNSRIADNKVPSGLFKYELRGDDNGHFSTIEKRVLVNHAGTILTKKQLKLNSDNYFQFNEETSPNFLGEEMTLIDFVEK